MLKSIPRTSDNSISQSFAIPWPARRETLFCPPSSVLRVQPTKDSFLSMFGSIGFLFAHSVDHFPLAAGLHGEGPCFVRRLYMFDMQIRCLMMTSSYSTWPELTNIPCLWHDYRRTWVQQLGTATTWHLSGLLEEPRSGAAASTWHCLPHSDACLKGLDNRWCVPEAPRSVGLCKICKCCVGSWRVAAIIIVLWRRNDM